MTRPSVLTTAVAAVLVAVPVALASPATARAGRQETAPNACDLVPKAELELAARSALSDGLSTLERPKVSGCGFVAFDTATGPNLGILVTNRARTSDLFDVAVLELAYGVSDRVADVGRRAYFAVKEKRRGGIDSLLLAVAGKNGVQVAVSGKLPSQDALETARTVARLVLDRLGGI